MLDEITGTLIKSFDSLGEAITELSLGILLSSFVLGFSVIVHGILTRSK